MKTHKIGITLKIAILVCLLGAIFFAVGTISAYILEFESLRKTALEGHREMARLMAESVASLINNEAESIKISALDEVVRGAIKESNAKYQGMNDSAAKRYLADMAKKWADAPEDSPLVKDLLANKASLALKQLVTSPNAVARAFVTDRQGGLVASSYRVPSFYQADKDGWQKAFDGGKGALSIEDIVFDESLQSWCLSFAVPVKDDGGEVIGIYNALVGVNVFFKPLEGFKIGTTGSAALVDDKSYLIYHAGAKPFANKFCSYDDLQKALRSKDRSIQIDGVYRHPGKTFVVFSEVTNQLLANKGIRWWVFVAQDAKEVFQPLSALTFHMMITAVILLIVSTLAALVLGTIFVDPIPKLRDAITYFGRGNMDYRIKVNSGDEIEQLADSLNRMAESMKKTTVPIDSLNKEAVEHKKAEDTINTLLRGWQNSLLLIGSMVQEAILLIKGDLKIACDETHGPISVKQKKAIDNIENSISKLLPKIDSLIEVSNIELGNAPLKMEMVDMKALLKKLVFTFEPKIREKGLDLRLNIPKTALNVRADEVRISQVLANLIDNAIKFTNKGYIEILVKDLNDGVESSVIDTGIGISRDDIPKVFGKFQQFGPAAESKDRGLGLGLSIAKAIVEKHNGTIWVESPPAGQAGEPGKGSKFTFKLPKHTA